MNERAREVASIVSARNYDENYQYLSTIPEFNTPTVKSINPPKECPKCARHAEEAKIIHEDAELLKKEPKAEWIKCAEKMPNIGQDVWNFNPQASNVPPKVYTYEIGLFQKHELWMPCQRPATPDPEESELIKKLKNLADGLRRDGCGWQTALARAISVIEKEQALNAKEKD